MKKASVGNLCRAGGEQCIAHVKKVSLVWLDEDVVGRRPPGLSWEVLPGLAAARCWKQEPEKLSYNTKQSPKLARVLKIPSCFEEV